MTECRERNAYLEIGWEAQRREKREGEIGWEVQRREKREGERERGDREGPCFFS